MWGFKWSHFLHRKFTKNLFFGHLNINYVRNKFEALEFLIEDKFDDFLVSESNLNSRFLEAQFKIPGYRIFRQDRDKYEDGLMFYINQNISCKKIETFQFASPIEILTLVVIAQIYTANSSTVSISVFTHSTRQFPV